MKLYKTQVSPFLLSWRSWNSFFPLLSVFLYWLDRSLLPGFSTNYARCLFLLCGIDLAFYVVLHCCVSCSCCDVNALGNAVRVALDHTGSYVLSQWIITIILVWCTSNEVFYCKVLIWLHCEDIYSVVVVVVGLLVVYEFSNWDFMVEQVII